MIPDVITLPVVIAFAIGGLLGWGASWVTDHFKDKRDPENAPKRSVQRLKVLAGVVFTSVMLFITVSTNQSWYCARETSQILQEEQRLATVERNALAELFTAAIQPPPDIAALPQEDPKRKAWGVNLGNKYLATTKQVAAERAANEERRSQSQSACGGRLR